MGRSLRAESDEESRSNQGWLTRENMLGFLLVAGSAVVLYLCFLLAQPFLPGIAFGLTLALMLRRPHQWLRGQFSANLATVIATVVGAALILGPMWFVADQLFAEAYELAHKLGQDGGVDALDKALETSSAGAPVRWIGRTFDLKAELVKLSGTMASNAPALLAAGGWLGGQFVLTLIVCFYLLRDRRELLEALRRLLPFSTEEFDAVKTHLSSSIRATVVGSLTMAAVQGSLGGLAFFFLGLPTPVLWGAVMGVLAVIPMAGTFVIWVPAALMLAGQGQMIKAAVLVAWGLFAIGMIDNVLYPFVVGKEMRLHPMLVMLSLLGGIALFGAAGLVIGPGILSLADVLIGIWRRRTLHGQAAETALAH